MKRLLLCALLLGAIGGLLQSLGGLYFYYWPSGVCSYLTKMVSFISVSLFAIAACITRGVVEKSFQMIKKGVLFGMVPGVVVMVLVILNLNVPWLNDSVIFMLVLGVCAGVIWGIGKRCRLQKFCVSVGGLIGGAASILAYDAAIGMMEVVGGILTTLSSPNVALAFYLVFVVPAYRSAQSVTVWLFIALADKYYLQLVERSD